MGWGLGARGMWACPRLRRGLPFFSPLFCLKFEFSLDVCAQVCGGRKSTLVLYLRCYQPCCLCLGLSPNPGLTGQSRLVSKFQGPACVCHTGILHGSRGWNSDPHGCAASISPTGLPPQTPEFSSGHLSLPAITSNLHVCSYACLFV